MSWKCPGNVPEMSRKSFRKVSKKSWRRPQKSRKSPGKEHSKSTVWPFWTAEKVAKGTNDCRDELSGSHCFMFPPNTGRWIVTGQNLGKFIWKIRYTNLEIKGAGVKGEPPTLAPVSTPLICRFLYRTFHLHFPKFAR